MINGAQTLQSYNDWVSKGVMGSFGLNGGSTRSDNPRSDRPTAKANLDRLRREERELREEFAEHEGDTKLSLRLQATRTDLAYARIAANLASLPPTNALRSLASSTPERERTALTESQQARLAISQPTQNNVNDGPVGGATRPPQAAPAISLGAKDLEGFCDAEADSCDSFDNRKWNVWLEGRVVGAVDGLAQTNALGFVGSSGVDYKIMPWLALGMSVGAESFETKFGTNGVRSGTLGFTAMPYVGVRLTDNMFASAFVGVSTIAYNTNPLPSVSAGFNALRFLFGGAVSGIWRDGPWRFQPSLYGTYGTEAQNGYRDSAGNVVNWQNLTYGRIGAGPEIGYAFQPTNATWSIEPYVLAKANLDFASSNASLLNGQSVVLRPGTLGSGSTGLGVDLRFESGFYFRVQGSYDSIGVTGLDVWSGLIRGGMTF